MTIEVRIRKFYKLIDGTGAEIDVVPAITLSGPEDKSLDEAKVGALKSITEMVEDLPKMPGGSIREMTEEEVEEYLEGEREDGE